MRTPSKPSGRTKSRPAEFHESIGAAMPVPMAAPIPRPALVRVSFYLIWALAVTFLGVAIGRVVLAHQTPLATEPGVPVATNAVQVTSVHPANLVPAAHIPSPTKLAVAPTILTYQSQTTGDVQLGVTADQYQTAASSDALAPTFTHFGLMQGHQGTDPVR